MKSEMSAGGVLSRLEKAIWSAPAHAMLREVRNATGYARAARSADALVVSLWPSRGVWFAGVETKVSRGDWRRELKDPEKSSEIQRFCDYWWVAAPVGVVELGEVPETWGLVEVDGAKCKVTKQAPKLTAEPLSAAFVAAVLRNRADIENSMRARLRAELKAELGEPVSDDAALLRRDVDNWKRAHEQLRRDLDELQKQVRAFEEASGVRVTTRWSGENLGAAFALAQRLEGKGLRQLADQMDAWAKQARALERKFVECEDPSAVEVAS